MDAVDQDSDMSDAAEHSRRKQKDRRDEFFSRYMHNTFTSVPSLERIYSLEAQDFIDHAGCDAHMGPEFITLQQTDKKQTERREVSDFKFFDESVEVTDEQSKCKVV